MVNIPSLTIVIPTHNRRKLLGRAILSVLQQTDQCFEVVIVDDGSTDDTATALHALAGDARFHFIRHDMPLGPATARNAAIVAATGQWIAFLDDDDELSPGFVEQLRRSIAIDDGIGWAWCGIERHHHEGASVRIEPYHQNDSWDGKQARIHGFLNRFTLSSGVAVRRAALLQVGLFDVRFDTAEDIDLAMRLIAARIPYASINQVLYRSHIGEGMSLSRSGRNRPHLRLLLIQKNLAFLQTQRPLLAHYRTHAMSGCYREGLPGLARAQAWSLLSGGMLGLKALEIVLRFELVVPLRRRFAGKPPLTAIDAHSCHSERDEHPTDAPPKYS